jgi:Flp pilus assembly pilin Flp
LRGVACQGQPRFIVFNLKFSIPHARWRPFRGEYRVIRRLKHFAENGSGATAIEYGLIALGIGIAILVGIDALGAGLNTLYGTTLAGQF